MEIYDKKTINRLKKVARSVSKESEKIIRVVVGDSLICTLKKDNNLSDGNKEVITIFNNINFITSSKRLSNDSAIELEEPLRRVMNMSSFILSEFNYEETLLQKKRSVRRKFGKRARFMYEYACDDKNVMQCMRDVRNLFNHLDA